MTYLAFRLNYIHEGIKQTIILLCEEISLIIWGLISSMTKK